MNTHKITQNELISEGTIMSLTSMATSQHSEL